MATITLLQKYNAKKISLEIDLNQWEKLADIFGFYNINFIRIIKKSLKESRAGKVRRIDSLRDLER